MVLKYPNLKIVSLWSILHSTNTALQFHTDIFYDRIDRTWDFPLKKEDDAIHNEIFQLKLHFKDQS